MIPEAPALNPSIGLNLDRVVLLGRTLAEYERYFALNLALLEGARVLDVAGGVSSFSAEGAARGIQAEACDPIYALDPAEIEPRCQADLDDVLNGIQRCTVYRWGFYKSPERVREFRERAYRSFLDDFRQAGPTRYHTGRLPELPFTEATFDLALCSYFLFVYQEHLSYEFHRDSIRELMRVTRGELRIYPLVTFQGVRSDYLDPIQRDPALAHLKFEIVPTDFEFLAGSANYLSVRHA